MSERVAGRTGRAGARRFAALAAPAMCLAAGVASWKIYLALNGIGSEKPFRYWEIGENIALFLAGESPWHQQYLLSNFFRYLTMPQMMGEGHILQPCDLEWVMILCLAACYLARRRRAGGEPCLRARRYGRAVAAMTDAFGCRPEDIRAAIGPCIGKCCFETDADVPEAMVSALDEKARPAIEARGEKFHVDLKAIASDSMTKGFSGSDLYNLCQTAAYMPIREIVASEEKDPTVSQKPKVDSMGLLSLEDDDSDAMDVEEKKEVTVRPLQMKDFEKASKEVGTGRGIERRSRSASRKATR